MSDYTGANDPLEHHGRASSPARQKLVTMRILFYIEPVSFKRDIRFLSPTLNVVRCIINANQNANVQYGIATSSALIGEYDYWLQYGGSVSIYRKILSEKAILEGFDFDTKEYAKFLFNKSNDYQPLSAYFDQIRSEFDPDVIVSFTQNSLIEGMSGEILTLFCERGPLPRWNDRDNFYFDPRGHQRTSIFSTRASEIRAFGAPESGALEAIEKFRLRCDAMPARRDAAGAFRTWLDKNRKGRSVAMIANQPHDSLLVQGATGGLGLETYMMQTVARLPADWMAFGTYHVDMGDCSRLDERLATEFPNYAGLPPELRQFGSDPFSSEVDAVITIGSKAALVAALLGKKVIANPNTMLAGIGSNNVAQIADASQLTPVEAGRVLAFLASRYTTPNEYLFERNGYWLEQVERMRDPFNVGSFATDATLWDPEWMDRMYGGSA